MLKALINEWISVSLAKILFKNLQKYWVWRDCQVKDREGRKGRKGPMGERGRGRAWWWRCLCLAIQVVSDRSHRLAFPSPVVWQILCRLLVFMRSLASGWSWWPNSRERGARLPFDHRVRRTKACTRPSLPVATDYIHDRLVFSCSASAARGRAGSNFWKHLIPSPVIRIIHLLPSYRAPNARTKSLAPWLIWSQSSL